MEFGTTRIHTLPPNHEPHHTVIDYTCAQSSPRVPLTGIEIGDIFFIESRQHGCRDSVANGGEVARFHIVDDHLAKLNAG